MPPYTTNSCGCSATSGSRLFMSMRNGASVSQLLQVSFVPVGAAMERLESWRGLVSDMAPPVGSGAAVALCVRRFSVDDALTQASGLHGIGQFGRTVDVPDAEIGNCIHLDAPQIVAGEGACAVAGHAGEGFAWCQPEQSAG